MENHKIKEFFISSIMNWGSENYRTFPWRESSNPYHFLVVEFLLQKTKAEQVIEIYEKFIQNYSSIEALANSDLDQLNFLLNPLGLYYRGQRLKETAYQILNQFNGIIPNKEDDLITIKGIGKYIARAILCFGFNYKTSILDVNIGRIFIRFFNLDEPKRIRDSKKLWEFSDWILPVKNFRYFNFYLLDFGSKICQKRNPKCDECLLSCNCFYFINKI